MQTVNNLFNNFKNSLYGRSYASIGPNVQKEHFKREMQDQLEYLIGLLTDDKVCIDEEGELHFEKQLCKEMNQKLNKMILDREEYLDVNSKNTDLIERRDIILANMIKQDREEIQSWNLDEEIKRLTDTHGGRIFVTKLVNGYRFYHNSYLRCISRAVFRTKNVDTQ